MKKFDIAIKLLSPLLIGLFLIAVISISLNYFFIKENIVKNAKRAFLDVTKTLEYIVQKDKKVMEGFIEQLKKDQNTVRIYQEDDKEKLFNYLRKTYEQLHEKYKLTHFYIHKPNRENYIRVHNKSKNSDLINRTTLKNAQKTLQTISGVEFGIFHNLTLRVVSPWIIDGNLIGFLELGKEVDLITEEYTKLIKNDVIFTIKKELITEKDFSKWKNKNHRNRYYHSMDNYYIIDSTIKEIDKELQSKLNNSKLFENEYVENDSKKYFINSRNYYDVDDNYVGKIFVLHEVTQQYEHIYSLIIKVTIISFTLVSLMLWYYFRYIRKTENNLNKAYHEIQEISIHDGLTNLYNKQYYLSSIPKFLRKYSRFKLYISFILIDADNFKKYNDNYGHLKGDEVLKDIARITMEIFQRENDFCFRVGGEEFLVFTASQEPNNGLKRSKKLRKQIENLGIKHEFNSHFEVVTASIGVTTREINHNMKIEELYDEADKALYLSKKNGRNQVSSYLCEY